MNEEKISSDKVPEKFVEWLLAMGCPPEKVPSVDKIHEMCRGQYYMVWRSLIEHVKPKDSVLQKRLQVFCDDIKRCQKKYVFQKRDSSVVTPEQLTLWQQQAELKQKVAETEEWVRNSRHTLNQLLDKISSKLSDRNLSRRRLQDGQRRAWLLQHVAEELRTKKTNLLETRAIADSLCLVEDVTDIEVKLDKCLALSRRQFGRSAVPPASVSLLSVANPIACSSIASTNSEYCESEEHLISLVKCSGDMLWSQLCERRAALAAALPTSRVTQRSADVTRITPQSVLTHTAALHCTLVLDAVKNRTHIVQTQKRIGSVVAELNNNLFGEHCELLVLRCERVRREARVNALRSVLDEMTSRAGAFAAAGEVTADRHVTVRQITTIDKAIASKRDELKRLISSLAVTERKIQNVRECLIGVFNSFHSDAGYNEYDRFGGQLSLPQESIATLKLYYEEWQEKQKNRIELSLNLDVSDNCSFTDPTEMGTPTFKDELKMYLKKFKLEKNKQLVLDSGEKIWLFQTLQASIERLHEQWQGGDVICPLVCPSASLAYNLQRIILDVQRRYELETLLQGMDCQRKEFGIDISKTKEDEQSSIDKIKKRLNENILSLQKTTKTLELGRENLCLWSENEMRKYISTCRTVDGKTFREYEAYYMENLSLHI